MSDHVWVSSAKLDSSLSLSVKTDIGAGDGQKAIEALGLMDEGRPVPPTLCPTRIWADPAAPEYERMPVSRMPPLFDAGGFWIVSDKAAKVIAGFDLGGGALHPVSQGLFEEDQKTRVPGEFFVWVIGNQKTAFLPAESPSKRPFGVAGLRWKLPWKLNDFDIAVSLAAVEGPASWVDPALFNAFFVSRELGDALDAAGFAKSFRLVRARIG